MSKTINLTDLQNEAIQYNEELRLYAYFVLQPELDRLGIRQLEVANIDKETEFQRKGGLVKPYAVGGDIIYEKLGKVIENELKIESYYLALKDHRMNYKDKKILNNPTVGIGENQTKKHPLEDLFISQSVRTTGEDILDALFFAERDINDNSPLGIFNGYETIIDAKITAGEIATSLGNLYNTGAIVAPSSDTDTTAIKQIVDFLRSAHPIFRRNECILYVTYNVYYHAVDALKNQKKNYSDVTLSELNQYLRSITGIPVNVIPSNNMGTGDRIHLTLPLNFDFGMNTKGDDQYVQVRSPYEDPNIWQFWIQGEAGCRVRTIHEKVYQTNNGTPVANALSGDYDSGSGSN